METGRGPGVFGPSGLCIIGRRWGWWAHGINRAVVEDEGKIRTLVRTYLEGAGMLVV
ncbi:hypothetical protein [Euzebya sp.]|uniref:hypothetical protein n=1 Tax=Euzebya sp. TaxID=1971409 RepID=UPI0035191D91